MSTMKLRRTWLLVVAVALAGCADKKELGYERE